MDKYFLEFWGNVMLAASRGQTSADSVSRWLSQGVKGAEEVGRMFRKFYGLPKSAGAGDPAAWTTAQEAFETAFRSYLDVLQVVPKKDVDALRNKCDDLEQKVAAQEEVIAGLRRELRDRLANGGDAARGFEELVKIQSEEFQKLTDSLGKYFSSDTDKDD